ncbi:pantoate--beta-alanine ligase [Flavobacteriaceae bacterium]|nr:pantoate--beta-alanine ligase [Flavobacteriaceae bacterium]
MKVYITSREITQVIKIKKAENNSIGFVPTMGALHNGHLTLVEEALQHNACVVVSIFVNPTQFNNQEDLKKYPRNLDRDISLLETLSSTKIIVFAPTIKSIYAEENITENFDFDGLEVEMEGRFRVGHFDGVGTVVKKLFQIIEPNYAYFGEKDFQQLQIIRKLVDKHHIPTQIIGCKIHRETNGLAMSSRNERLNHLQRIEAALIFKTLKTAKIKFGIESTTIISDWVSQQFLNNDYLKLEYFVISDEETLKPVKRKLNNIKYRAFIAVYADDIRLIDNIALN